MRNTTTMIANGLETCAESDWTDGVQIDELGELESLSVRTRNSTYELVVTSPATAEVLVRGGSRFPEFTAARVCGSTAGGRLVTRTGIYPGLCLELEQDGRHIHTSAVIAVDRVVEPRAQ